MVIWLLECFCLMLAGISTHPTACVFVVIFFCSSLLWHVWSQNNPDSTARVNWVADVSENEKRERERSQRCHTDQRVVRPHMPYNVSILKNATLTIWGNVWHKHFRLCHFTICIQKCQSLCNSISLWWLYFSVLLHLYCICFIFHWGTFVLIIVQFSYKVWFYLV